MYNIKFSRLINIFPQNSQTFFQVTWIFVVDKMLLNK
jgi:hypothetical protein